MSLFTEKFIYDVTSAIGNGYLFYQNGIGNTELVGSSIFEADQLRHLAIKNIPKFGVMQYSVDDFEITLDTENSEIILSNGYVGFNGTIVSVSETRIPYKREAEILNENYDYFYGIKIALNYDDFLKSQNVIELTVSSDASAGDTIIYVENIELLFGISMPTQCQISNALYFISEFNINEDSITLSAELLDDVLSDSIITCVIKPKPYAVYGVPIRHNIGDSYEDIDNFDYFPNIKNNSILINKALVKITFSEVWEYEITNYDQSYVIFPTKSDAASLFPTSQASEIFANDASGAIIAYSQTDYQNSTIDLIGGIEDYTATLSTMPDETFNEYWSNLPFRKTDIYCNALTHEDINRFEFSENFKSIYYFLKGTQLRTTFAIFRGDLYNSSSYDDSQITNLTASFNPDRSNESDLKKGTYNYAVTAVINNGTISNETAPTYVAINSNDTSYSYIINHLKWSSVDSAAFYHVYRQSNFTGDILLTRLTEPLELISAPVIPNEILNLNRSAISYFKLNTKYTGFKISESFSDADFSVGACGVYIKRPNSNSLQISEIEVVDGGNSYSTNTIIRIVSTNASASATATINAGEITSVYVGDGGSNYTTVPTAITQDVTGEGAEFNVILTNIKAYLVGTNIGGIPSISQTNNIYESYKINLTNISATVFTKCVFYFDINTIEIDSDLDWFLILEQNFPNDEIPGASDQLLISTNTNDITYTTLTSSDGEDWSSSESLSSSSSSSSSTTTTTTTPVPSSSSSSSSSGGGSSTSQALYFELYGYTDHGSTGIRTYRKGVKLFNKVLLEPERLSIYIPPIDTTGLFIPSLDDYATVELIGDDILIQNSLYVTIEAQNGLNNKSKTFNIIIPKGTERETRFLIGNSDDVFDRVLNVTVLPYSSSGLTLQTDGNIDWSIVDLITVETIP